MYARQGRNADTRREGRESTGHLSLGPNENLRIGR